MRRVSTATANHSEAVLGVISKTSVPTSAASAGL